MKPIALGGEVYLNEFDHRKLGQELELFSFHKEGPGMPFWLHNGLQLKNQLIEFWRARHQQAGYKEIQSPLLLDQVLWEKSGHWDLYKEHMFVSEVERRAFALKPMNCPGAILVYQEKKRSHKELPLKICEMGQVHRNEFSGSLHGLLRVRSFMVDDGHIFCAREHILPESKKVLQLSLEILKKCGFHDFQIELSVRSHDKKHKYLGSDSDWQDAESLLELALKELQLPYIIKEGEAKFYGPAIDIKIKDSSQRDWQCSSLQMDFNLPQRFRLKYYDAQGKPQSPFILHRCVFGSLERFIGILLEHYKGLLPFWLAPLQVRLISLSPSGKMHLEKLKNDLQNHFLRWDHDDSDQHMSQKIKKAHSQKVPLLILAGDQEAQNQSYSLRLQKGEKKNHLSLEEVKNEIQKMRIGD